MEIFFHQAIFFGNVEPQIIEFKFADEVISFLSVWFRVFLDCDLMSKQIEKPETN